MNRALSIAALIGLSACAPYANDIKPIVDTTNYKALSCADLHNAWIATAQEKARLTTLQNDSANDDVISIIWLGFPVPARAGADRYKLAQLKGSAYAIETQYLAACTNEEVTPK